MRTRITGFTLGAVTVAWLGAFARPAAAQVEVPAIVNTYRANPAYAAAIATGTVNLNARAVRELYYESFIKGYDQGEPNATGAYGIPAQPTDYGDAVTPFDEVNQSYPRQAHRLSPADRMPSMPITRNPGPDGVWGTADDELLLHIRVYKLPTRDACQNVVNHMMRIGLLPGDPDGPADVEAYATGRWRILIHPPRTKGAPPAPSLYYPEAIGALTPATANADIDTILDSAHDAVYRNFWGNLKVRWRGWDDYVREVWENGNNPIARGAQANDGQEPVPFFLPYPRYLDRLATNPIDHTTAGDWQYWQPNAPTPTEPSGQFFDADRMWENRLLDPNQEAPDQAAVLTSAPGVADRTPETLSATDTEAARPIELIIAVDPTDRTSYGGDNATPNLTFTNGRLDGWWLRGVHTVGTDQSDPTTDTYVANFSGTRTQVGTDGAFWVLDPPVDITVNLLTGQVWDPASTAWVGTRRNQPVVPGVGMVEYQFEYETSVPGVPDADLNDEWAPDPWGPDGRYDPTPAWQDNDVDNILDNDRDDDCDDRWYQYAKEVVCGGNLPNQAQLQTILEDWDPRGADGDGDTEDDNPFPPELLTYAVESIGDARGADNDWRSNDDPVLQDPLNQTRDPLQSANVTADWRILRYSGWPFHPAVFVSDTALAPAQGAYLGGPIVCRFVVSSILAVPEEQRTESAENPVLARMAYYAPDPDPATGRYYPQLDALPDHLGVDARAGTDDIDLLERAVYLLGYRADIPVADENDLTRGPGSDYFFPIRPGASSAAHRFFLRSVLDHRPGGRFAMWNDPDQFTDPDVATFTDDAVEESGYRFRGVRDLCDPPDSADYDRNPGDTYKYNPDLPLYLAYVLDNLAGGRNNLPTSKPDRFLHCYALQVNLDENSDGAAETYEPLVNPTLSLTGTPYSGTVATDATRLDRGITVADEPRDEAGKSYARWDVRRAFDGDVTRPATTYGQPPLVVVPNQFSVGVVLDPPSTIDRIELWGDGADASDWEVEYATQADANGEPDWTTGTGTVALSAFTADPVPDHWAWTPAIADYCYGVRVRNVSGGDLILDELRVITRADLRSTVRRPLTSPLASQDPAIVTTPLPDSAVKVTGAADREFAVLGDNVTAAEVKVEIPRFQPPSRDAVERQILTEQGAAPSTHATAVQPRSPNPQVRGAWDRYRGEVAVYLDDAKNYPAVPGKHAEQIRRQWDVTLYRLRYRPANEIAGFAVALEPTYQFVSWYEEDCGFVGQASAYDADGTNVRAARLEQMPNALQRVAVESYATFEVECSVAYERRLRFAEKLLDFGKVVHGGISQWVPVTLVNEGNVPLRDVKLYVDLPMTPIDVDDAASWARAAQFGPLPSWHVEARAIGPAGQGTMELAGFGGSLAMIPAAPVGSPRGTSLGGLYVRVGYLDADPQLTRPVPVGQPMGNYRGRLRAFVDDRGAPGGDLASDGNDRPDAPGETSLAGAADLKLTVQESPLGRIGEFWDNEVDRNASLADLQPYDSVAGTGTYQPVPHFVPMYTDPDASEATPAIFVGQPPAGMDAEPPNPDDRLVVAWSSLADFGGARNWLIYGHAASRPPMPANTVLETNYRSFQWPDANPPTTVSDTTNGAAERNLYPSFCAVDGATDGEYVLLWHNERDRQAASGAERVNAIQFVRGVGEPGGTVVEVPDEPTGNPGAQSEIRKQTPRAMTARVGGATVMWIVWQSAEGGKNWLGFNALTMPGDPAATIDKYSDAIRGGGQFNNYRLHTPPGLANIAHPWALGSKRHEFTNVDTGTLRAVNVFYDAWSPVWRNQDIYWSRYRPMEDPADPASLTTSPMAEDAYRLSDPVAHPTAAGGVCYAVVTQPGGRIPFPRVVNELLRSNANHTVYASSGLDWIMPPDRPRVSALDPANPGARTIAELNHRGFADTDRPIVDENQVAAIAAGSVNGKLDPVFVLRVYRGATLGTAPVDDPESLDDPSTPGVNESDALAPVVEFDLGKAYFDPGAGEWVLPINGPGWLVDLGIDTVRVHPGIGRVTFNKPLYRRGATPPVYVYATYRPCARRLTTDQAADLQPAAAFDFWERLVVVWRRVDEGGHGRLWYRTHSLSVPLYGAPATALTAVVNDDDSFGDQNFNGSASLDFWSFTAADGTRQIADASVPNRAWSGVAGPQTTSQGYTLSPFGSVGSAPAGTVTDGRNEAGMVHFSFGDAGRRVRIFYQTAATNPVSSLEEARVVPGLGPERQVPADGLGDEAQPALAVEHYYAGYPLATGGPTPEKIMASRFWLAWISTRTLYVPGADGATPARPGRGGSNVYYGVLLPDFEAASGTGVGG